MRKYFTCVQLFVVAGMLTSCLESTTPKTVTPKMPEIKFELPDDIQQTFDAINAAKTCDKKDSEQPQVSNEVLVNKIVIEDQIDSQKMQIVNCDNKVTFEKVGPVRSHSSKVKISAPEGLEEKVNFVSIENHRTCDTIQIKSTIRTVAFDLVQAADEAGNINLSVSESDMKLFGYALSVHEGNNVFTVRYYGKCLVYKKVFNSKYGDEANCEKAEELGSKMAYLELHINRPLIDGIRNIDGCYEKKK